MENKDNYKPKEVAKIAQDYMTWNYYGNLAVRKLFLEGKIPKNIGRKIRELHDNIPTNVIGELEKISKK